jgi:hypothetical protein
MAVKGMRYLKYRVSVLSFPSAQQLSLNVAAYAGCVHYKVAVVRETTYETLCSILTVRLELRLRMFRGLPLLLLHALMDRDNFIYHCCSFQ